MRGRVHMTEVSDAALDGAPFAAFSKGMEITVKVRAAGHAHDFSVLLLSPCCCLTRCSRHSALF
jgi:hypothetical protein